jgi:hypothetical protein
MNVQKFNILKICNLEVYMHSEICMHECFDLITNPFNYKCESCQIFIHPSSWIVISAKCNLWIIDLMHSKWMISTHLQILII